MTTSFDGQIISMPWQDYEDLLDARIAVEQAYLDQTRLAEHWQRRYTSCRDNLIVAVCCCFAFTAALMVALLWR